MTNWSNNITLLKAIQSTDPTFWSHLTKLAQKLQENKGVYIDDHQLLYSEIECQDVKSNNFYTKIDPANATPTRTLYGVGICQTLHMDTNELVTMDLIDTCAWLYTANFIQKDYPEWKRTALCKNPIYIDNLGRIRLTTSSMGSTLTGGEISVLMKGWSCNQGLETNFVLPTEIFISTMIK
jgi:hypothetical protein